jgi:hypothetical protein
MIYQVEGFICVIPVLPNLSFSMEKYITLWSLPTCSMGYISVLCVVKTSTLFGIIRLHSVIWHRFLRRELTTHEQLYISLLIHGIVCTSIIPKTASKSLAPEYCIRVTKYGFIWSVGKRQTSIIINKLVYIEYDLKTLQEEAKIFGSSWRIFACKFSQKEKALSLVMSSFICFCSAISSCR